MKLKVFQKGFNYSQDGRGNRLIYHLQGCNMHCPWCSNPEGMSCEGVLLTEKEWLDESCCPRGAVESGRLKREICRECKEMNCVKGRRQKGLRFSCQEYDVETLVQECIESRPMFFDGGGVTLTGGEVTMQFDAAKLFLTRLKEEGIHTAIESNGTHPRMEEYLSVTDEWIVDIKSCNAKKHRQWLGVSNAQVLKNVEMAAQRHRDVLLRIPLIPGFNDSGEDAQMFAEFLGSFAVRENVRLELLTYHEFGKGKWEQCGYTYRMKPERILPETVQFFEWTFRNKGIQVVHT